MPLGPLIRVFRRNWRRATRKKWNELYEVGFGTYGNPTVFDFGDGATLKVGAYCSIASRVTILLGGNHRTDWITTFPFPQFRKTPETVRTASKTKGDVIIGNDVWIGLGATILSGVTIGDGAVLGACSVVTKNVPPYAVVGGNAAKVIRMRFSESEISFLSSIQWWNWSQDLVNEAMPHLLSSDVGALRAFCAERDIPASIIKPTKT